MFLVQILFLLLQQQCAAFQALFFCLQLQNLCPRIELSYCVVGFQASRREERDENTARLWQQQCLSKKRVWTFRHAAQKSYNQASSIAFQFVVGIYKRKQESDKEKKEKNFLFFLITFLVEFLFPCFLTFLCSFINSHLSPSPEIEKDGNSSLLSYIICLERRSICIPIKILGGLNFDNNRKGVFLARRFATLSCINTIHTYFCESFEAI